MTHELSNQLVEVLNRAAARMEDEIENRLGVVTHLRPYVEDRGRDDYAVRVELTEVVRSAQSQLTSTPLLRAMFKKAYLTTRVFYTREKILQVVIGIEYTHPQGGSNGLGELMCAIIDPESEEAKFENY